MSQNPASPQPYPPQQPYGQPPVTPPGGAYAIAPQRRTSAAAVTSLVLGILSCIPGVGLLAVVLGGIGIKTTGNPQYSGRPMAVIGLVLGLLSLVVWGLAGGGIYAAFAYTRPAREAARLFASDLAAGNIQAAQARTTSNITREELDKAAQAMKAWGAFQDTTMPVAVRNNTNGVDTAQVGGVATFSKVGTVPYSVRFVKQGGQLKVDGFELVPPGGGAVNGGTTPDISKAGSGRLAN